MQSSVLLANLTLAAALSTASPAFADEPSEGEIAALFDTWNAALATGNSAAVADLYAADGVLVPTVSNRVRATRAEVIDYFDHFLAAAPRGSIDYRQIRVLDDDIAVDTGLYTFALPKAHPGPKTVKARYTFVYRREGDDWKIVSHHSSALPEPVH